MNISFERIYTIAFTFILNKALILMFIGARSIIGMLAIFILFIINFMILAKSIDKQIDIIEMSKKKNKKNHNADWVINS